MTAQEYSSALHRIDTSKMNMKTRTARLSDASEIARLSQQVHMQHAKALPERYREILDETDVTAFFATYLESPGVHMWIAETGTGIAGYLSAEFRTVPENPFRASVRQFELAQIAVDEQHRGKGIGKALFDAYMKKAVELEADELLVHTLHFNTAAHEFFRSCDFENLSLNLWKPLKP